MTKTLQILPETNNATLCISATGRVTAEDFSELFEKPLLQILEKYDHYNLCMVYEPAFEGWTEEAADLSFKCISVCSPKVRKAAYVNPPQSRMLMMKMLEPLMNAEIRYFDSAEIQDALEWVKE